MAIFSLFQHVSEQVKGSLNVPVDDSYTQLNVVGKPDPFSVPR